MKKLEEISKCQNFQVYKGNTLIKIVDNRLFVEDVEFLGNFYNFSLIENQVWTWDNNSSRTRVFDILKKRQLFESEFFIYPAKFPYVPNKNNVFQGFGRFTNIKESLLLNYDTFSVEQKYPLKYGLNGIWFFITEKSFVSLNSEFVAVHNLSDEKVIWMKRFADLLQINSTKQYGDIILHDNKLFFYLADDTKGGIFAFDALTGQLVNQTTEIGGSLILANGLLYMTNDDVVTALNPQTFEYEKKDYSGILKEHNLLIYNFQNFRTLVIKDNLLYFASLNKHPISNEREVAIGIIDMAKDELIEVIPFKFPKEYTSYSILEIQMHENRLFVLTNDDILHIFEQEKKQ